jgi:hypothetical protein
MMRTRSTRLVAVLLLTGLVAVACAGESTTPEPSPVDQVDQEIYGGFPIDPPAPDEVVLTLEGATKVDLTMAELEALAVLEVTIDEPFVRRRETFRVIPLQDLLDLVGITDEETVQTIALNDYRYSDLAGELRTAGALIAVARDGGPIPMDAGGPIRLVFADDSTYASNLDAWNWSLRTIRAGERP